MSNFHFYNDLSQLGLSEGASINNLLEKMPAPSIGVFYCLSKSITGLPFDTQCVVTIFKNGNPFRIEVQDIWSGRTYVAIYSGGTVGKFVEYALKSDLDLKLNNTSIFVGNGGDFGQAIKKAGIVQLNRVGFFICNNPSNSPLENGLIILAHNVGYWNNHPMYIQINGSSISCGTLNCSDYTHITKD